MPVRAEKQGSITTVILDRPGVKNAVDRATAAELAVAFQDFDRDNEARVGELRHGLVSLATGVQDGAQAFTSRTR